MGHMFVMLQYICHREPNELFTPPMLNRMLLAKLPYQKKGVRRKS